DFAALHPGYITRFRLRTNRPGIRVAVRAPRSSGCRVRCFAPPRNDWPIYCSTSSEPRSEQPIEAERISDAEHIGRCVVVETDADVEIDLLGVGDAIAAAGVEEVARAAMDVVVADIFDEQEGLLADLALDHEGGLAGELVGGIGGHDEIR